MSVQLNNVIEVIQGTIESIDLPEKVDIIISEWVSALCSKLPTAPAERLNSKHACMPPVHARKSPSYHVG